MVPVEGSAGLVWAGAPRVIVSAKRLMAVAGAAAGRGAASGAGAWTPGWVALRRRPWAASTNLARLKSSSLIAGLAEDDVGELDVAVEDAVAVGRREAAGEADAELERPLPGQGQGQLGEALAAQRFGDEVGSVVELADAVDGDHVGVLDPRGGAGLDDEALAGLGLIAVMNLIANEAVEHAVAGEVDLAHGAAADLADELVLLHLVGRRPVVVVEHRAPPLRTSGRSRWRGA